MKLIFILILYVPEDWEPKDLVDWFENNRSVAESSLAHELKHKYDHNLIGKVLLEMKLNTLHIKTYQEL